MIRTMLLDRRVRSKFFNCSFSQFVKRQFFPILKIALALFFLIVITPVFAQKFEGGLLAGFNGSQVRGNQSYGFHKLGFVGGAWVQSEISDNFYWSGEIKYNQKGSRINPNSKNGYLLYIYRLNYIDLPVLVGYRYTDYLSFFGGLSFGYLVNSQVIDNYGVDPAFSKSNLHRYEIGTFVGAKVDFDRLIEQGWAKKFILDFRYQFSAMSVYNGNKLFYSPYGQFNSLISTSLYYIIEL
jgi:hypothetical protein